MVLWLCHDHAFTVEETALALDIMRRLMALWGSHGVCDLVSWEDVPCSTPGVSVLHVCYACILIVRKFCGGPTFGAKFWKHHAKQVVAAERLALNEINHRLFVPTPMDYLDSTLKDWSLTTKGRLATKVLKMLCLASCASHKCAKHAPSKIAVCACHIVANTFKDSVDTQLSVLTIEGVHLSVPLIEDVLFAWRYEIERKRIGMVGICGEESLLCEPLEYHLYYPK